MFQNTIQQRSDAFYLFVFIIKPTVFAGTVKSREVQLLFSSIQVKEQFKYRIVYFVGAAIGLVNLINLNSLELISISGGISNAPDELLFNPLKQFIRERAYSAIADKVKMVKSSLGDNAPMIGAALLYKSAK